MSPSRLAVAAALAAALTACSQDAQPQAGAPSNSGVPTTSLPATPQPTGKPQPTAKTTPKATPTPTPSVSPLTDLADGQQIGYFKDVDPAQRRIVVDVAQYLTGKAAEQAWAEDGNSEEMPFSFYIRNQNTTKMRTLTYAPTVSITVNTLASEETGSSSKDVTVTAAKFASLMKKVSYSDDLPFFFTLKNGVIVSIREQFIP